MLLIYKAKTYNSIITQGKNVKYFFVFLDIPVFRIMSRGQNTF